MQCNLLNTAGSLISTINRLLHFNQIRFARFKPDDKFFNCLLQIAFERLVYHSFIHTIVRIKSIEFVIVKNAFKSKIGLQVSPGWRVYISGLWVVCIRAVAPESAISPTPSEFDPGHG